LFYLSLWQKAVGGEAREERSTLGENYARQEAKTAGIHCHTTDGGEYLEITKESLRRLNIFAPSPGFCHGSWVLPGHGGIGFQDDKSVPYGEE